MIAWHRRADGELRLPLRLVWNDDERRPRSPIRITLGLLVALLFADFGRRIRPTPIPSDGPLSEALNELVGGIPQAASIVLGVSIDVVLIDRRRLTDLGVDLDSISGRRFAGGFVLGSGIPMLSFLIGLVTGYFAIVDFGMSGGPMSWMLILIATGFSILLTVIAEEFLARGYLITNVIEGLDGVPRIQRGGAAAAAIGVASLFFFLTHSFRGQAFGWYAAGLAVPLGVAYVLSADLSLPVGIHFGVNLTGGLIGWQPIPLSVVQLSSSSTIAATLVFPVEAALVQLVGAAMAVVLLLWWFRAERGQLSVESSLPNPTLRWQTGDSGWPLRRSA